MTVTGDNEVLSCLRSLGEGLDLAPAAELVADTARALCPVDTGYLRSTIKAEVRGNTAVISASAPYAAYVELGTLKQSPQPFLLPALLSCEKEILQSIKETVMSNG